MKNNLSCVKIFQIIVLFNQGINMNNIDHTDTTPFQFGQTDEMKFTLASPKSRIKARLIDYLFYFLFVIPFIILKIIFNHVPESGDNTTAYIIILASFFFGIVTIIFYLYQLIIVCKYGQTFGKRICNIRVIKTNGRNPGFFGYLIRRELLYYLIIIFISIILTILIMLFLPNNISINMNEEHFLTHHISNAINSAINFIFFIICCIMLFKHKEHRTLQDLLANTLVIQCEPKPKSKK